MCLIINVLRRCIKKIRFLVASHVLFVNRWGILSSLWCRNLILNFNKKLLIVLLRFWKKLKIMQIFTKKYNLLHPPQKHPIERTLPTQTETVLEQDLQSLWKRTPLTQNLNVKVGYVVLFEFVSQPKPANSRIVGAYYWECG